MTTRALDVVTILHALSVLDGNLNTIRWNAKNPQQNQLFAWLEEHRELLAKVTGLEAKASRFYQELNDYLTAHKFDPMVKPFNPAMGIGVVSILDKLVRWLEGPGTEVEIPTERGNLPGFELPRGGVNIYQVPGYPNSYLLELLTKSDDTLWLFVHDDTSLEGLDMVTLSMDVMNNLLRGPARKSTFDRSEFPVFAGAQVPVIDFNVKPDISWLQGADTLTKDGGYFYIVQASQQFKMRMDKTGARVKAATVISTLRGMVKTPKLFVLNRPFYGWWTQNGLNLPMATFFADWDSFHQPAGSLDDL